MGIDLKPVEFEQPKSFEFSKKNKEKAKKIIARYPAGREQSAVMPLLTLAQQQNDGWLPQAAIDYVAAILGVAPMKVKEVATFYSMYNLQPIGQYHIQVCGTTPCALRGAKSVLEACESRLGLSKGETSADGKFTLTEVECLGACVNAPVMEVTTPHEDGYYEDLTPHLAQRLIDEMMLGKLPEYGSQSGRNASEPETGATVLLEEVTKPKAKKAKAVSKITTPDDTGEPAPRSAKKTAKKKKD